MSGLTCPERSFPFAGVEYESEGGGSGTVEGGGGTLIFGALVSVGHYYRDCVVLKKSLRVYSRVLGRPSGVLGVTGDRRP